MMAPSHLLTATLLTAWLADDDAATLLARARQSADAARYPAADALYRKIVATFPTSAEADEARDRLEPNTLLRVVDLEQGGPPENRIDVFILGDGYLREAKYQRQFDGAAAGAVKYFQQAPVHKRYFGFFNFHAMNIASAEDGVDNERKQFDTALGAHESGASQGQVAVDQELVMRYLARDPRSDGYAIVIVRLGTLGTGGGGVATIGGGPSNTLIHEWGHAFADLLDEYTSDVGYTGPVPRGHNVTDEHNPATAPWKHWLDADTKGVGLFPGGAGRSQGAWRACASGCAMNSGPSFCLVCREAVVANIYGTVSPLDDATPHATPLRLTAEQDLAIDVIPMVVATDPQLEVTFSLEPTQEAFEAQASTGTASGDLDPAGGFVNPFLTVDEPAGSGSGGRWGRGSAGRRMGKTADSPLPGTPLKAQRVRRPDQRFAFRTTLRARDLAPGRYLVHALVRDPTPWLIKPEWLPLLSERRTWKLVVP